MSAERLAGLLRPRLRTALVYGALTVAVALAAYWAIFISFATYDDEGTLLADLFSFVHGRELYTDIFAQYGPFYFELFGGFFALTGKAITTDTGRLIVVAIWTSASLVMGLVAQRLTGRLALGAAAMAVTFAPLTALVSEPMHPIGLSMLLLALLCLAVAAGPGPRPALRGGLLGAVLAALTLTKINLGAFAIAAMALAVVLAVPELRRLRALKFVVAAGFLLLPLFLMRLDLDQDWVRDLLFFTTCCAGAVVAAATTAGPGPAPSDPATRRWLVASAAGFVVACVAMIIGI